MPKRIRRTPRLRLGSMPGITGAGSLIRSVRRYDAQVQEVKDRSSDSGVAGHCCRHDSTRIYPCSHHISLERLREQLAPVGRGQGTVEAGEPQNHQRCPYMGGPPSLLNPKARLSARWRVYPGPSWRATEMFAWWAITHNATMMPNQITSLDAAMSLLFPVARQWRGASEFFRSADSSTIV